jgi:hypothetical protein
MSLEPYRYTPHLRHAPTLPPPDTLHIQQDARLAASELSATSTTQVTPCPGPTYSPPTPYLNLTHAAPRHATAPHHAARARGLRDLRPAGQPQAAALPPAAGHPLALALGAGAGHGRGAGRGLAASSGAALAYFSTRFVCHSFLSLDFLSPINQPMIRRSSTP